ncbi:hypothetical protein LTS18_000611 [Coniosporium uncinatum]|uniref:Uncharacterized protein n=1 Tax=Coniosporium uncinatum TaxID=93489 RepID=A0ACC3DV65_9PEZI|nr:hypothetical protein LTS18_000611 [Coniosporium uncinatum]
MASLAEILLTRVRGGYTSAGSGFSHYLAGRNNASAQSFSEAEWRGSSSTLRSTLRCWQTTGVTTICTAKEVENRDIDRAHIQAQQTAAETDHSQLADSWKHENSSRPRLLARQLLNTPSRQPFELLQLLQLL